MKAIVGVKNFENSANDTLVGGFNKREGKASENAILTSGGQNILPSGNPYRGSETGFF